MTAALADRLRAVVKMSVDGAPVLTNAAAARAFLRDHGAELLRIVERDREDAARYRWLRDDGDQTWFALRSRARLVFPHVPGDGITRHGR